MAMVAQELGVAVAVGDLRGRRLDTDTRADRRRMPRPRAGYEGVGADGARDLADRHRVAGTQQPIVIAGHLERPGRQLEAERHGLGPDAVGRPIIVGVAELERLRLDHREQRRRAGGGADRAASRINTPLAVSSTSDEVSP